MSKEIAKKSGKRRVPHADFSFHVNTMSMSYSEESSYPFVYIAKESLKLNKWKVQIILCTAFILCDRCIETLDTEKAVFVTLGIYFKK